jgi:hypothetical protein
MDQRERDISPSNKYKEYNSKDYSDTNNNIMMDYTNNSFNRNRSNSKSSSRSHGRERERIRDREEKEEKAVQGNIVEVIVGIIEELIREMMIIIKDMKNQRIQEELTKNHIRNFVVLKMV